MYFHRVVIEFTSWYFGIGTRSFRSYLKDSVFQSLVKIFLFEVLAARTLIFEDLGVETVAFQASVLPALLLGISVFRVNEYLNFSHLNPSYLYIFVYNKIIRDNRYTKFGNSV